MHYRQALPNAELVYLRRAGHNLYQDQPAAFLAVVRAFLTGRPAPPEEVETVLVVGQRRAGPVGPRLQQRQ